MSETERSRSGVSDGDGAVLHLVAHLGEASSGLGRAVWELASAQAAAGHRTLIGSTSAWGGDVEGDDAPAALPEVRVFPTLGPASLRFAPAAERWAVSHAGAAFSVVHQHGIWPAFTRVGLRWRHRFRRPSVVSPHGMLEAGALAFSRWKKALARRGWEGRSLADASCLHATAESEVGSFRAFGLRNPVAVIPLGVADAWVRSTGDGARFRAAYGIPAGPRLLLFFARIHRKKGLDALVEAMARAGRRLDGWHLVVAGPEEDAALGAAVREAVAAHRLADRVHFVGELRGQARRDVFAASEVMVLPTLSENFALAVAESLATGVPVLTTHAAVAWRPLETERCGWWNPGGPAPLLAALVEATSLGDAERTAMGERGRALVLRDYAMGPVARRTLALYAWLRGEAERPDFVVTG